MTVVIVSTETIEFTTVLVAMEDNLLPKRRKSRFFWDQGEGLWGDDGGVVVSGGGS